MPAVKSNGNGRRGKRRPAATRATVRNRLFRCANECGFQFRASETMLVRHGYPTCACGGRVLPWELEDVLRLLDGPELETHPVYRAYMAKVQSVIHGQAPHGIRGHGRELRPVEDVAMDFIHAEMRQAAAAARLAAIAPADGNGPPVAVAPGQPGTVPTRSKED